MLNSNTILLLIILKLGYFVCFIQIFITLKEINNTELILLTSEQKFLINKMLDELKPTYILTTYLVDPINLNKCYLFIEHIYCKEIRFYTIF